jgi:hypothetical protein
VVNSQERAESCTAAVEVIHLPTHCIRNKIPLVARAGCLSRSAAN